jgi:hypothetical protein
MSELIRAQTVQALESGQPIYYERTTANGDNLWQHWTYWHMINRLASEYGISDSNINLRTYMKTFLKPKPKGLDLGIRNNSIVNTPLVLEAGFVVQRLETIAGLLNMDVLTRDKLLVPQPMRTDFAPFNRFDRNLVTDTGEEIREELLNRAQKIVIIGQFGSIPEKRLSNAQAGLIADVTREILPDSYIAVLSDRDLLAQKKRDGWKKYINKECYYDFPFDNPGFTESLYSPYGESVDQVVAGTNINNFSAWFYGSDVITGTDSFGSWLGSGSRSMRPDRDGILEHTDAHFHYTMASPKVWRIPGTTFSRSKGLKFIDLLSRGQFAFLTFDQYYNYSGVLNEPEPNSPHRGITQIDMKDYITAYQEFLQNHSYGKR